MHRLTRREMIAGSMGLAVTAAAQEQVGSQAGTRNWIAFIGSYTRTTSKGIYAWRFDANTGKATPLGLAAESQDPTWVVAHPNGRFFYASNELVSYNGMASGSVTAFEFTGEPGKLKLLNRVASGGLNPSHMAMDPSGRWLIVANYGSATNTPGTLAVFGIHAGGSLDEKPEQVITHPGSSVHPTRQQAAHVHSCVLSPDGRTLLVADLGADRVVLYQWDNGAGRVTPADPPFIDSPEPGSGPRHSAFSSDGQFAYVNYEMNSTVTSYRYDAKLSRLTPIDTISTLPAGFTGTNSTAEIEVHPNGRFVYISNRGEDTIASFRVETGGRLARISNTPLGGMHCRSFKIHPSGRYLFAAAQHSDETVIFRLNPDTGTITPTGHILESPTPACVYFRPA